MKNPLLQQKTAGKSMKNDKLMLEYDLMFQLNLLSSVSKKPELAPFRKDEWIVPDEVGKQLQLIEEKEEQLMKDGLKSTELDMPQEAASSPSSSGSSTDTLSFITADSYYDECEDVGIMSFKEEEDKKD